MTQLSVNINKAALLRNSRGTNSPDLMDIARRALQAGADGLTVHPRVDERHITRSDARDIVQEFGKLTEVNFEGDLREDFLELVLEARPHQCTLVPVSPGEITSHRGWNFQKWSFLLKPVVERLKSEGIRVSVFADPKPEVAEQAAELGADRIEIYTEAYARDFDAGKTETLQKIMQLEEQARKVGISLNAGHDLTLENLPTLLESVQDIKEVSIGHHLFCHSLFHGFEATVAAFKAICRKHSKP